MVPSSNSKTTVYSVNHSDASFLSGYTEYAKNVDLGVELQADIDAFVKSIGAEVTGQKRTDLITAASGRMPRIDFTFEGEKLSGRGIAIVTTPRSVIMVQPLSVKPNGLQEVDRFVGLVPDIRVSAPTKSKAVVRKAEMRRQPPSS